MASKPSDRLQRDGINALSREFNRFEQVHKPHSYHLAEKNGEDAFDDDFEIQTCDIGLWRNGGKCERKTFAEALGSALERIGFAIITGHGIDPALYESTHALTHRFFESISEAERAPYLARRHGSVNQGYFPMRETTIIHPDLVEGWVFCRRAFDLQENEEFDEREFWPAKGYESQYRLLVRAQEALIQPVMQSLLQYLGCDPTLFDRRLDATNFGFRLNYYPPLSGEDLRSGAGRMLGHEDVDLFTFLPAPEVEGLQVLNRENMKWIRLKAPPGSIILNTGDYMQRLSNDVFPSTTHRVAPPIGNDLSSRARVTCPMAIYLWEDEILEVLPGLGEPHYPPVRAEEFHTAITSKYYGEDYGANPD